MNKKLIFRILGALASSLIIVSVFVPFVSVTGYSYSLWGSNTVTNSLYLPIMIIVFGVIGVLFFALNKKTEFSYMSTGAILFFLVIQTADILNQGVFNTLSVGYYFLVVGAIVPAAMTFLLNLKTKENNSAPVTTLEQNIVSIQPLEPNQVNENLQPIQPLEPNQMNETLQPIQPLESNTMNETLQPIQPLESNTMNPMPQMELSQINPVIDQYSPSSTINPIVQEFASTDSLVQPQTNLTQSPMLEVQQSGIDNQLLENNISAQSVNPVVQEFVGIDTIIQPQTNLTQSSMFEVQQPVIDNQLMENNISVQPVNPVVQEFSSTDSLVQPQTNLTQPPLGTPQVKQDINSVDIFGQPINK